ncbi:MAG: hypothetical protein U0871_27415 [Gemmataceae bacterium]
MIALFAVAFFAADGGKLTVSEAKTDIPNELSADVRSELDPHAVSVADDSPLLTVWFRRSIPVRATAEQLANGLTYREIPEGTLLGAVRFARAFVDYRKQTVPAGVYTLRFAVQPEVGDHLGTTPHPEFALLGPADKDRSPDPVEPKGLIKMSSGVTGGDHPSVMLLWPHRGAGKPAIADREPGARVLALMRPVSADGGDARLGFALTVAGHSKSR